MGLSPRASTSDSNEPLVFLRDVGEAYRASGRTKPIMDQLSIHPYPNPGNPTDGPGRRLPEPGPLRGPGPRPRQAGGLGRVQRHGAADDPERPDVRDRRDRLADRHDRDAAVRQRGERQGDQRAEAGRRPEDDGDEVLRLRPDGRRRSSSSCSSTRSTGTASDETGRMSAAAGRAASSPRAATGVSQQKKAYVQLAPLFAEGRAACAGPLVSWAPAKALKAPKAPKKQKRKA